LVDITPLRAYKLFKSPTVKDELEPKPVRGLSTKITTVHIDNLINTAKSAGAIGAKLLGAGGGGFVLLFAPPAKQKKIKEKLKKLLLVPFKFEDLGSQVIFYQPNGENA